MKQVVRALKRTEAEKRIPVLKLEIDYELATFFYSTKKITVLDVFTSKTVKN